MSVCVSIKKKKREVCAGDLEDAIILNNRSITTPDFDDVDFDLEFDPVTPASPESLALIETVTGSVYFDDVGEEVRLTHRIYIPYDPDVTAEVWITIPTTNKSLDILYVEDLDERHEFMLLYCADRGLTSKNASKA